MKEQWKPVVGHEGRYEVSSHGRIKSIQYRGKPQSKIMKLHVDKDGYEEFVAYQEDGKRCYLKVHRVVYLAFIGSIPEGYAVHHKDHCPYNNKVKNLEAISQLENIRLSFKREKELGKPREKLSDDVVSAIKWEINLGQCGKRIAEKWGIRPSTVYRIAKGQMYKHIN